jgi:predicted TIM-barrel fold metal-dependent hydrolase
MILDLSSIPILDTHEHLHPESERVRDKADVLATFFSHYASTDLAAAGLSPRDLQFVRDTHQPLADRWRVAEPYWRLSCHTAYGRALRIATQDLYGVADLDAHTIEVLNERMRAESTPGLYARVFERANIRLAIVQDLRETLLLPKSDPPGLTRMVINGWLLALPRRKSDLDLAADSLDLRPIHSLSDWLGVCETVFKRASEVVALKLSYAYLRSLEVSRPTFHEAEQAFRLLLRRHELSEAEPPQPWQDMQPLHDYLIHRLIQLATEHGLPIQIHTGILEGSFGDLRNAHPYHLIPILQEYREGRFVLFHGGYPWTREYAALAKSFPNSWADLSWLWAISPKAGRDLLHELIETVPVGKVCAFGGDYLFVEGVYGHAQLARESIARVLEEKIREGWFDETEAFKFARAILHDNAAELYRV